MLKIQRRSHLVTESLYGAATARTANNMWHHEWRRVAAVSVHSPQQRAAAMPVLLRSTPV